MNRQSRRATRPRLECLDGRWLLSTLAPAQIDSAYGLNAVSFSNGAIKGNGAGQTIAIIDVDHDPTIYGDLWAFDAQNNLPNPILTANLPVSGQFAGGQAAFTLVNFAGSVTDPTWNEEEALDVEMAHAAAPMASLVLVEAKSDGVYDLLNAIQAVKTLPSVSVVSMSWGGPEFYGQQTFDNVFTTPGGHRGITYLASTGDYGPGAAWPSSSPNVIAVGGTSLTVSTAGARASESAWSGSGGGVSTIVSRPTYQAQVVTGSMRKTPDVAIVADPGTGVTITSRGSQMGVGGTSLSTPIWAGLIAVADQGLAAAGKTTLDGATQTLPDLYKAPAGTFFDVTTGNRASVGYDTSTGLGSPNAAKLIPFLDGLTTTTTTSGQGSKASASVAPSLKPALALPTPGENLGGAFPFGSMPTTPPGIVANLISVPSPSVAIDPNAVDEALGNWSWSGPKSAASSITRTKPRG